MKKLKRSREFEIALDIKDEKFIRPPSEAQRNAVLNRALKEFVADLHALNLQTNKFVPGKLITPLAADRQHLPMTDDEIMEDWLIPVMKVMANAIARKGGDILEIGFGRGISAEIIQQYPIRSHTIIECNPIIADSFIEWREKYEGRDIKFIHGLWQHNIEDLGQFDGIFFHTYPLNENEYMNYVNGSITFAAHFFEHASKHLNAGGAFTYFSNEICSLSREHQRLLLKYFSSFCIEIVPLKMPQDVMDTWWAETIVVVKAIK